MHDNDYLMVSGGKFPIASSFVIRPDLPNVRMCSSTPHRELLATPTLCSELFRCKGEACD